MVGVRVGALGQEGSRSRRSALFFQHLDFIAIRADDNMQVRKANSRDDVAPFHDAATRGATHKRWVVG